MTIERRLQHAARELREVHIDIPPLGAYTADRGGSPGRSRLQTVGGPLLVPLLFVAGGLFAIGATRTAVQPQVHSDIPAAQTAVTTAPSTGAPATQPAASGATVPSLLEELEMIAGLVSREGSNDAPATPTVDDSSTGQIANLVGPL